MKIIRSANPKSLNLNQDNPSKNVVLLVKSVQNWVFYNFSQRSARVTKLYSYLQYTLSHVIKFCEDVTDRGYDVISFISKYQNTIILRRARVSIFADIIKIVTTFIKKILEGLKNVKKNPEIMNQNTIYIFISWYSKICWFPVKTNADVSRTYGVCHVIYIFFGFFLGIV